MVALFVIALLIAIILAFRLASVSQQCAAKDAQIDKAENDNVLLRDRVSQLSDLYESYARKYDNAQARIQQLAEQLNQTNQALQLAQTTNQTLVARNEIDDETLSLLAASVEELKGRRDELLAALEAERSQLAELQTQHGALQNSCANLTTEHNTLQGLVSSTKTELENLLALRTNTTNLDDGDGLPGFVPELDRHTAETLELVQRLLATITNTGLRAALLKWVWECAYRPVFQQQLKGYGWFDGVSCIYGLQLVAQPDVWYIGQAVNLKER